MDGLRLWRGAGFAIDHLELGPPGATIHLRGEAISACCPDCGQASKRMHSRNSRTLQDLPAFGRAIVLKVCVRRFFCDNPACSRRTFVESLGELAPAHARKTARLIEALRHLGLALGGEAASRLSRHLAMATSGDCILRHLRQMPLPSAGPVRIVGVDDWAYRKRERYGTIICDLQTHRPIDLLPERSSPQWADWLRAHEDVQIISRDRGGVYALGAQLGAPLAIQVADRGHLLTNCRTALLRLCQRWGRGIALAWRTTQPPPSAPPDLPPPTLSGVPTPADVPPVLPPTENPKRSGRLEHYHRVVDLHA